MKKAKEFVMSNYDRVQALVRTPDYLEDLSNIRKATSPSRLKAFYQKYSINSVIIDQDFANRYDSKALEGKALFTDERITTVVPHKKGRMVEETVRIKSADGKTHTVKAFKHDIGPFLNEGRYLTVEIDLMKNRNEILGKIDNLTKLFGRYVRKPETRKTQNKYNAWNVLDLHDKEGLTFSEIARRFSGYEGNAAHNENLMAEYKKVRRAYEKATKMLRQIKTVIDVKIRLLK